MWVVSVCVYWCSLCPVSLCQHQPALITVAIHMLVCNTVTLMFIPLFQGWLALFSTPFLHINLRTSLPMCTKCLAGLWWKFCYCPRSIWGEWTAFHIDILTQWVTIASLLSTQACFFHHLYLGVVNINILDFHSVWMLGIKPRASWSSCAPPLDHTLGQHRLQTPVSKSLRD